ncbi:hypothetical protein JW766_04490 [Candidatus Dojkabacteria bacterium]|nr:hypothetical protein [Candidatus Dojkabacteria bacterium]
MRSHLTISITATLFNILAEYAIRGIQNLFDMPLLPFMLFLNYFPYFLLLEHLIVRYKLNDLELALIANLFGMLWMLVGPSVIWFPPTVLGINWPRLLFVNLFWWVTIQTIIGFHIANRLVKRNWEITPLSKKSSLFAFFWFVAVSFSFRFFAQAPMNILGFFILLQLIIINLFIMKFFLDKTKETTKRIPKFKKNLLVDLLCAFLILYLFFAALCIKDNSTLTYVTYINQTAMHTTIRVSFLFVCTLFIYRILSKKPIPI